MVIWFFSRILNTFYLPGVHVYARSMVFSLSVCRILVSLDFILLGFFFVIINKRPILTKIPSLYSVSRQRVYPNTVVTHFQCRILPLFTIAFIVSAYRHRDRHTHRHRHNASQMYKCCKNGNINTARHSLKSPLSHIS